MADFEMAPVGVYQVVFTYFVDAPVLERKVETWPVIAFDGSQAPLLMGSQALVSPNTIHPDYDWTLTGGAPTIVTEPPII